MGDETWNSIYKRKKKKEEKIPEKNPFDVWKREYNPLAGNKNDDGEDLHERVRKNWESRTLPETVNSGSLRAPENAFSQAPPRLPERYIPKTELPQKAELSENDFAMEYPAFAENNLTDYELMSNPTGEETEQPESKDAGENAEAETEAGGVIKPGYNAKGEWSEDPDADNYGKNSAKYGLLTVFDKAYDIATENGNRNAQIAIDVTVDNLRNYDTESITQAYYLIDNQGANWAGHAGLLLVNEDGEGILFSYFRHSDAEGIWNVASDTRIGVFDAKTTEKFLGGATIKTPSSSGDFCTEQYDGNKQYKISSWQGMKMLQFGRDIATSNPEYNLFFRNCDEVANAMLLVGGIYPNMGIIPNLSYLKKKLNIF